MSLTQEEKNELLDAIREHSQRVDDLPAVTGIEGLNFLLAMKDVELVKVPIFLLNKLSEDIGRFVNLNVWLRNSNGMELTEALNAIADRSETDEDPSGYYLADGLVITFFCETSRQWVGYQWQGNPYTENPEQEWYDIKRWEKLWPVESQGGTGLTPWQQQYLQGLEDKEFASRFSVSVSVNPSGKEMDGTATSVRITVRTSFDGKPVDATVSDTSGLELSYLSVSTGVYEAVHEIAAPCVDETGKMSRSFGVSASYTPEGGSGLTRTGSASVQLYAQCRIMQTVTAEAPDGAEIAAATNRRRSITGTYDIPVEPGKYVWLCVPSGIGSVSKVTSSGFAVPVEPPVEIKVPCGTATVRYRCWRISGAPQSSPMSVVVS